jgi:hypothetical protein
VLGSQPAPPREGGLRLWGVLTTIFEPTPACHAFVSMSFPHKGSSHFVAVGDKKTPDSAWASFVRQSKRGQVVYLSPADQLALPYRSIKLMPWNHFGRKNIGFLYAIDKGAEWIFDFDDDNVLNSEAARMLPSIMQMDSHFPVVDTRHHL